MAEINHIPIKIFKCKVKGSVFGTGECFACFVNEMKEKYASRVLCKAENIDEFNEKGE